MNSRAKKQLTILIMVAMLLVLLMVAAVFLMPNGKHKHEKAGVVLHPRSRSKTLSPR